MISQNTRVSLKKNSTELCEIFKSKKKWLEHE